MCYEKDQVSSQSLRPTAYGLQPTATKRLWPLRVYGHQAHRATAPVATKRLQCTALFTRMDIMRIQPPLAYSHHPPMSTCGSLRAYDHYAPMATMCLQPPRATTRLGSPRIYNHRTPTIKRHVQPPCGIRPLLDCLRLTRPASGLQPMYGL